MSEEPEPAAQALLNKAYSALSDAKLLVEHGSPESAINRAYYAAFSAARAALLAEEGESPSTHSGVIRRFSFHFVRTGRLSENLGETLTTAESMRNRADYEAFATFERQAAADLATDVRRFVEAVEATVES